MTIQAVVFDVGRVLYQWRLGHLFEKIVTDPARLATVLDEVVTEEWHFEHDRGTPLARMVPERIALYPDYETEIRAYAARFNETIPGPVPGSLALVERLDKRGVPLFAITNFGAEFWAGFRPTAPIFDRFRDIVVSGEEKLSGPPISARFAKEPGVVPCCSVEGFAAPLRGHSKERGSSEVGCLIMRRPPGSGGARFPMKGRRPVRFPTPV